MIADIAHRKPGVAALCERYRVRRLDVFGSAARGADFGPASYVDVLVKYEPAYAPPSLVDFPALRDALAGLFGRDVDLILDGVVRNPA